MRVWAAGVTLRTDQHDVGEVNDDNCSRDEQLTTRKDVFF